MLPVVLTLALAQAGTLRALDAQEALNDGLERVFDGLCAEASAGRRNFAPDDALPDLGALVAVNSCSLRALALRDGTATQREATLLLELNGRGHAGQRLTLRSEGPATLVQRDGRWHIAQAALPLTVVERQSPRFVESAEAAGLSMPKKPERAPKSVELLVGGLAAVDLDADGWLDVVALDGSDVWLFRGREGGTFVRERVAVKKAALFTAVLAGDFDGDQDPDLVLLPFRGRPLYLRNDHGQLAAAKAFDEAGPWHAGVVADFDVDGRLDVALLGYPLDSLPDHYLEATNGARARVLWGHGDGTFRGQALPKARFGFAGIAADLAAAGRPQLYVANDFGTNDLWALTPDGGATSSAGRLGLDDPGNGMSVDIGDLDGDGRLDLYVANMFSKAGTRVLAGTAPGLANKPLLDKFASGNTLYLAQPDGGFRESAEALGVNRALWAYGSVFVDYDDDGRADLAVANGHYSHPIRKDL